MADDAMELEKEPAEAMEAAPPETDLPRSSSSAMPDLTAEHVPRLKAKVHRRLSTEDVAKIPLSAIRFRPLQASDKDEMVALHTEWFPVSYDQDFYEKSVSGTLISIVATHCPGQSWQASGGSSSSSSAKKTKVEKPSNEGSSTEDDKEDLQENILGIITLSTYCEHHSEAMLPILGADCDSICRKRPASALDGTTHGRGTGALAYILTLGVAEGFRRRGLARELLRRSIIQVDKEKPEVQAVFLHVVTYNNAAIQLYESSRFVRIDHFPSFYLLHGSYYDSFLYALYIHGARPPWKWRLRNVWSMGLGSPTWGQWVMSAWTSLFNPPGTLTNEEGQDELNDGKTAAVNGNDSV